MGKASFPAIQRAISLTFEQAGQIQRDLIFNNLAEKYTEKHRYHHTLNHIEYMAERAEQYTILEPRSFYGAILLHDAIYEAERFHPGFCGPSNEEASAALLGKVMEINGVEPAVSERAKTLVL